MNLQDIPLFSLLTNRMTWLSSRQSVLATNVANADTPNYQARDMRPMDFEQMLQDKGSSSALRTTDTRHITMRAQTGGAPYEQEDAFGEGGTPTGNVVSLEQEMIKLSDTQIQYQTATNIYQKAVNMFRTALGSQQQ